VSGVPSKTPIKKGTVVKKNYQTSKGRAGSGRVTSRKPRSDSANALRESAFELPDAVTVAVAELAGQLEEGLLALAVGAGLQVLGAVMETEVTTLAGPKGRWNPDRAAVRHGDDAGEGHPRRAACPDPSAAGTKRRSFEGDPA
jgi:hypothetical protein